MNSATAEISRIASTDPDANPAVVEAPRPKTLKTALAAQRTALGDLDKVLQAIVRSKQSAAASESKAVEIQRQLEGLETKIAMGESEPAERDTLSAELHRVQTDVTARRNGLRGLNVRKEAAEKVLDGANIEVARIAAERAGLHIARFQAAIQKSLTEAFEQHAQLLKLARSLNSLPGAESVNIGIDPSSWATCDFTDRISQALDATGLRRTREGIDVFESAGYGGYSSSHLFAMLGAEVD